MVHVLQPIACVGRSVGEYGKFSPHVSRVLIVRNMSPCQLPLVMLGMTKLDLVFLC